MREPILRFKNLTLNVKNFRLGKITSKTITKL